MYLDAVFDREMYLDIQYIDSKYQDNTHSCTVINERKITVK